MSTAQRLRPRVFLARPSAPGPGKRLAIKDLFDTAGLVTTYGSIIFRDHVPDQSAEAVLRLEAAGWANIGKTNLPEFAYGTTSHNQHFGDVPNPLSPERVAGGSSGGSAAALANGAAQAALGSDSGGSVRIPSACCGTLGFKPTYGLVSLEGCFPLAPTFDHAGPMARTVSGCTEMLAALAPTFSPTTLDSLDDIKVGVAWTAQADPLVRRRCEDAAALFPRRRTIDLPLAEEISPAFMREVAETHAELWAQHRSAYGQNMATKIERCLAVTDRQYELARRRRDEYRERLLEAFQTVDLLITPTLPCVAPPAATDELAIREQLIRFTFPFNATGAPALAIPCGRAEHGLPASLQLVGPPNHDSLVLAAGEALDQHASRTRLAG